MVDLFLVRIGLGVTFADTLGNDARITLCVASVLAVLALHASRVLEEVPAECTTHNVVELVLNELVAVHFMNFLFSLTNGTFSSKSKIHWSSILVCLNKTDLQLDPPRRLQVEPAIDGSSVDLGLGPGGLVARTLRASTR